ncbi:hypothetical protein FA743_13395 [Paracoccus gahaiensis]|uniref:Uncharacterized protein n=1 Tax=Paracoccus gahaiensis TaxID=1706839 RepID=A0A4U0R7G7_9RHOB|nr:hypothetical protein FA743_13395 [Paracoccus gahaiensis]
MTLLILGAAAGVLLGARSRPRPDAPVGRVRAAGPVEMRDPPLDWTGTDERSDESFPASDPPGRY